jgi:hypothetical protein
VASTPNQGAWGIFNQGAWENLSGDELSGSVSYSLLGTIQNAIASSAESDKNSKLSGVLNNVNSIIGDYVKKTGLSGKIENDVLIGLYIKLLVSLIGNVNNYNLNSANADLIKSVSGSLVNNLSISGSLLKYWSISGKIENNSIVVSNVLILKALIGNIQNSISLTNQLSELIKLSGSLGTVSEILGDLSKALTGILLNIKAVVSSQDIVSTSMGEMGVAIVITEINDTISISE